jgi:hypothetical protein
MDLNYIANWCCDWDMQINPSKCCHLKLNSSNNTPLLINGIAIPITKSDTTVRDLGVDISPSFSFSHHIDNICSKARKVSFLILRAIAHPCIDSYRICFISYVRSILEYCSVVWNPHLLKDISLIERVQRNFTKIAFIKCFPDKLVPSYQERLSLFNLEPLSLRRSIYDLCLCYKVIHKLESHPLFSDMFELITRPSRTSNSLCLSRKFSYNNIVFHSFSFRVVRLWNLLPDDIVTTTNLSAFKSKVQQHLVSNFDFSVFNWTEYFSLSILLVHSIIIIRVLFPLSVNILLLTVYRDFFLSLALILYVAILFVSDIWMNKVYIYSFRSILQNSPDFARLLVIPTYVCSIALSNGGKKTVTRNYLKKTNQKLKRFP